MRPWLRATLEWIVVFDTKRNNELVELNIPKLQAIISQCDKTLQGKEVIAISEML